MSKWIVIVAVLALASSARAQELAAVQDTPAATTPARETTPLPEWLSRTEIGGTVFLSYSWNLLRGEHDTHRFDMTRFYLFAKVEPLAHVRLRATLDAPARENTPQFADDGTFERFNPGRYDTVVKNAFFELYDLFTAGLMLRFGLQDLPWVPFEEKLWGYRFQGPMFEDVEGYLSTTDLGAAVAYAHPSRLVEATVGVFNGEGWQRPEISGHKDLHARLTVRPLASNPTTAALAGLAASVGYVYGQYDSGDNMDRRRLTALLGFENEHAAIGVDYLMTWDPPGQLTRRQPSLARSTDPVVNGRGWSAFGWLDAGAFDRLEGLRVMARVEQLDPDTELDSNSHLREVVGVGYRANKYVSFLADGELVQFDDEAGADAAARPDNTRTLSLHTMIAF